MTKLSAHSERLGSQQVDAASKCKRGLDQTKPENWMILKEWRGAETTQAPEWRVPQQCCCGGFDSTLWAGQVGGVMLNITSEAAL